MATCFLLCALALFLGAFTTNSAFAEDKVKVVTTFTVIADMARNVAGDHADVVSITRPGSEIHDYSPTPQDIVKALDADVIFHNGMNLERWFDRFLQDIDNLPSYTLTEGIEPISIFEGPYEGKPNPHAWMSTGNALIYIENIKNALSEIDPENAEFYATNAEDYAAKISAIRAELQDTINAIPKEQRVLVTSEGAFSYLVSDLEFDGELYIWPINADQQGTPQQMRAVIDAVRARNVPVVFSESTISDKPARQIASETGALYGGALYVDSLSKADGPVPTYLDLLSETTSIIRDGFAKALEIGNQ